MLTVRQEGRPIGRLARCRPGAPETGFSEMRTKVADSLSPLGSDLTLANQDWATGAQTCRVLIYNKSRLRANLVMSASSFLMRFAACSGASIATSAPDP